MQRSVSTGGVAASSSSTQRLVSSVSFDGNSSVSSGIERATTCSIDGTPSRSVRPTPNAIDSKSSASARPTLYVNSSDSNAARGVPVGAVERAFASVRIVEANVCKGGEWLVPPKVRGVRVLMRLLPWSYLPFMCRTISKSVIASSSTRAAMGATRDASTGPCVIQSGKRARCECDSNQCLGEWLATLRMRRRAVSVWFAMHQSADATRLDRRDRCH
jgi:hypothetical protein